MKAESYIQSWLGTPEAQLLIAGCLVALDDTSRVAERVSRPFNEKKFLALCQDQRLLLVAHKLIVTPFKSYFSERAVQDLENQSRRLTLAHVQSERAVVEIHRAFSQDEIGHFFLKGPLLNDVLFSGSLLRYSKDIDVVVKPQQIEAADAALNRLGYFTQQSFDGLRRGLLVTTQKDLTYVKEGERHPIELHWMSYTVESVFDENWEKQTTLQSFHGEQVPVLKDLDCALYLCFHGAHHSWSRARWLLDIALFMKKRNLSWQDVYALGVRHRIEKAVEEAASLCHLFFGTPLESADLSPAAFSKLDRRVYLTHQAPRTKAQTIEILFHQGSLFSDPYQRVKCWVLILLGGILRRSPLFRRDGILRKFQPQ